MESSNKMRCSSREVDNLHYRFFTSTPLPNPKCSRKHLSMFCENSPMPAPITQDLHNHIRYLNKETLIIPIGKQSTMKVPTRRQSRNSKHIPQHRSLLEVVQEKTPFNAIPSEVKNKNERQLQSIRKIGRQSNFLDEIASCDQNQGRKRISTMDVLLDGIKRENMRKSTMVASPQLKVKTDKSIDQIVDQGDNNVRQVSRFTRASARINKESGKVESKGVTKKKESCSSIRTSQVFNKENIIATKKPKRKSEYCMEEPAKKRTNNVLRKTLMNIPPNIPESTKKTGKANSSTLISNAATYKVTDTSVDDWKPMNGQTGVFTKRNFKLYNTTHGFIKLNAKCTLVLIPSYDQVFNILDGKGSLSLKDSTEKIAAGHVLSIPAGVSFKISNSGIKKELFVSYTKYIPEDVNLS